MAPFGILLHVPRATKKLDSFPREISSAISRPAEKRSYFDWKIGERLERSPVEQRTKIIRMEEMVMCILFRPRGLITNFASFCSYFGTKDVRWEDGKWIEKWTVKHVSYFHSLSLVARHFHSGLKFYNM